MPSNPQPRHAARRTAHKNATTTACHTLFVWFPGFVLRPLYLHLHLFPSTPFRSFSPTTILSLNPRLEHSLHPIPIDNLGPFHRPSGPSSHQPGSISKPRPSSARRPIRQRKRQTPFFTRPGERVSIRSSSTDRTINSAHVHGWSTASRSHLV
ncbi:hypothetical protein BDP81DRAFT_69604 [Colletotrichum phormii]|uniref:Uncharacterized protein n=1 Tax=Colletotrichum phormii TaxID=359342 RepID=A0AAJ0EE62_9PEZI|nr:uncharacterized protein BDP81DRAFT_69604 [Colletotrichum phormii]KAK1633670.1 hypothetical protein BDP81DRAFT_69604 [Colletotrichum phormii]